MISISTIATPLHVVVIVIVVVIVVVVVKVVVTQVAYIVDEFAKLVFFTRESYASWRRRPPKPSR